MGLRFKIAAAEMVLCCLERVDGAGMGPGLEA